MLILKDHAEHEYMSFVKKHPELDEQPAVSDVIKDYGDLETWGMCSGGWRSLKGST